MLAIFESFNKGFAALKAARTLDLRPALGSVTLDLQLGARTIEATVAPPVAAVIMAFENQSVWTLSDLSAHMKVPCGYGVCGMWRCCSL